jgi:hypothetical protein
LRDEAAAKLKSEILVEDFTDIRPLINNIELDAARNPDYFDLRQFDMVYIDLSFMETNIDKYPPYLVKLLASKGITNEQTAVAGRSFLGKVRAEIMAVSHDYENEVVTIDIRLRNRSSVWT